MMKNGVICLGEALIDFIPLDNENLTYQKSPGGAPANVAVGIAQLGAKSTFLGKVGDDVLGAFLRDTLAAYHVNTSQMFLTKEHRTGTVFVTLAKNGERSFDFYINPSADRFLKPEEISEKVLTSHRVLHFGSISMIDDLAKKATKKAVQLAKQAGMLISYDPNLRLGLWRSEAEAKETIVSMLDQVDVVKISEEELKFITGEQDIQAGIKKMVAYGIPLLFITLGGKGCIVILNGEQSKVSAMKVDAVDTTGAGDAFVSVILYKLNAYGGNVGELSLAEAKEMAMYGNVSGGLTASKKGAMSALPTLDQVEKYVEQVRREQNV